MERGGEWGGKRESEEWRGAIGEKGLLQAQAELRDEKHSRDIPRYPAYPAVVQQMQSELYLREATIP